MDARCSRPGLPAEGEEPQASVVIYRSRSAPVTHSGSDASFSGSRPPDGGRPGASSAAPPLLGVQGGSPGTRPRGSGAPAGCPPLPTGVPSRTPLGTRTVTGGCNNQRRCFSPQKVDSGVASQGRVSHMETRLREVLNRRWPRRPALAVPEAALD